jgi:enoyl-CoA hydratase
MPQADHKLRLQSSTERVQTWLDGSTLHIRFNNPARHNALSVDMWEAVPPLLALAKDDDRVRLVVFSGAGEKAFVSGADISQFEDMRAAREAVAYYEKMAETTLMGIYDFPKPTLACIRGYCIGGGVNVAISCDIRIAATDSVFSIPAARLGLGYRYSAMKNLVDLVGPGAPRTCSSPPAASTPPRPSRWAWSRAWRRKRWTRCWPNTPGAWPRTRR